MACGGGKWPKMHVTKHLESELITFEKLKEQILCCREHMFNFLRLLNVIPSTRTCQKCCHRSVFSQMKLKTRLTSRGWSTDGQAWKCTKKITTEKKKIGCHEKRQK
jgi:hypothetical protein